MRPSFDTPLTPEQRRQELAGILAAGVVRLHARTALDATPSRNLENPQESSLSGLEVRSKTVLSVHRG